MLDDLWFAVVPLKRPVIAKSRLRGAVPRTGHQDLVLAMALDTVAAVVGCPAIGTVVVVCDDPAVRGAVADLGARGVADLPGAGLNAAMVFGASALGDHDSPVVALTADLPAARPEELAEALSAAAEAGGAAFVPDTAGTGTVLLTARSASTFAPSFGMGSAARHEAAGALRLDRDWRGLRRDVDSVTDLRAVAALGPGLRTSALLASTSGYGY